MTTFITLIEGGWLKAQANGGPPVIISSDEGISDVSIVRRSDSLVYVVYKRNGIPRKRMLVAVSTSITVGPEIKG